MGRIPSQNAVTHPIKLSRLAAEMNQRHAKKSHREAGGDKRYHTKKVHAVPEIVPERVEITGD
jgi:hypothetical protein